MTVIEDAILEVRLRTQAMTDGAQPQGIFMAVSCEPEDLMRRMLSGYVPLPEAETGLGFVDEAVRAALMIADNARTEQELHISLGVLIAQVFSVGVICARHEGDDDAEA